MIQLSVTDEWRAAHPGASIGLLEISGLTNNRGSDALTVLKRET